MILITDLLMVQDGKAKTELQMAREQKRIEKEKEKAAKQVMIPIMIACFFSTFSHTYFPHALRVISNSSYYS